MCFTIRLWYNLIAGCSAVGSARALGAWGREFESPHSDQLSTDIWSSHMSVFL